MKNYKPYSFLGILLFSLILMFLPSKVLATVDPLATANNKTGIHIITASNDEASAAASLVNSNGDWGYVTVLIESKDRNRGKWQQFFDTLRSWHLIPLIRLATQPEGDFWKRPYEGEEQAWADFLDGLNWPVKNRYVIIYNEPNHGQEWGNKVDAKLYAESLDKTITALKNKSRDFFVLNAGFDASTPSQPPTFEDELVFLREMEKAVPGIFNKLDGWVSHSYPNPGFVGSPTAVGRGTVSTWLWELQQLRDFGVTKDLPVFITETGWKHAEGLKYDPYLPSAEAVSGYLKTSFEGSWNDSRIAAVTPFLLNYQEIPFDHFSFRKVSSESRSGFYPQYQMLAGMQKTAGKPVQENQAKLVKGEIFKSVIAGEIYNLSLTFKNAGQSIWNERDPIRLVPIQGGNQLGITRVEMERNKKVEPGQTYTFHFKIKAPQSGVFKTSLNLYSGETVFDSGPFEFSTEVKSPVVLMVKASLKWKKDFSGDYFLNINGPLGDAIKKVTLAENGASGEFEVRDLLPDYAFDFTLEKRSEESNQTITTYKPAIVRQTLHPGLNILDFGMLDPVLLGNIIHPRTLWKLLPFSN